MSNIKYAWLDLILSNVNLIVQSQRLKIPETYYTVLHIAWCLYIWGNVTI